MTAEAQVVVSCAGGGKTTKLIERLMFLLRRGATPGGILLITFTNKAAAEIRARLLAKMDEEAKTDPQMAVLRRRILLAASPADSLLVHTFHSWFLTLLRHRPGGFFTPPNICNSASEVMEESWRRWQKRAEDSPAAELQIVLRELTPAALRKMCEQFIQHRAAYEMFVRQTPSANSNGADLDSNSRSDSKTDSHSDSKTESNADSEPRSDSKIDSDSQTDSNSGTESEFDSDFERAIESGTEEEMRAVRRCAAALAECFANGGKTVADARLSALRLADGKTTAAKERGYFLTANDSIRKVLQTHAENNGYEKPLRQFAAAMAAFFTREEQLRADAFNAAAMSVCADFAREWDAVLHSRNETTFDGLELRARKMLEAAGVYDALSYRLSARYKHILIDEFQDTSPMQWAIVHRWLLDAHGEDAPSVFIVGDPKQAIYGFRHGDSRLLDAAAEFLRQHYNAKTNPPQNKCYRCGENILQLVNAAFDKQLRGFLPHQSANKGGRVEWHILPAPPPKTKRKRMRNPLRETVAADDNPKLRAVAVANKVAEILREWRIPDDKNRERKCRPGDILILMPQLTHAATMTDALAAEEIPCAVSGGGGSFLDSFECADILDLTSVLLSPGRDYALARVLKSPLFSLTDRQLSAIANENGESLWAKVQLHSASYSRRARVLLKFWRRRAAATLLPAHDFLSRLFLQGDVFARYRAATPPSLHLRVRENLFRLLDLSLQIAGGARPLLPQFLDEVRRATSEETRADSASPDAVRLMSVHAAKGLESPVVIVADSNFVRSGGRGESTDIFADWPPYSAAPERFVISLRRLRRAYADLKQNEKEKEEQENANLLYVAITRAERALIIFSSAKEPGGVAAPVYRAMQKLSAADETKMIFGDSFSRPAESETAPHSIAQIQTAAVGVRESKTAAAVRGEIRHRLVALLVAGIPPATAHRLVAAEDGQRREAETMAFAPPLQKLLQNAAEIFCERDFVFGGETIRPDLVVVRKDAVWIVDYKTGDASPDRHRPQLETYRRAIAARYPALPARLAILDIRGKMHYLDE